MWRWGHVVLSDAEIDAMEARTWGHSTRDGLSKEPNFAEYIVHIRGADGRTYQLTIRQPVC